MRESITEIPKDKEVPASLEEFRREIEELKNNELSLKDINNEDLGWAELDMWYHLKDVEKLDPADEKVKRFKEKLYEVKRRNKDLNNSRRKFYIYLENQLNK